VSVHDAPAAPATTITSPSADARPRCGPILLARIIARRWRSPTMNRGRLAALVVVGVGCARFEPTLPLRARTADVDLELRSLRVSGEKEVVYASRSTEAHQLGHGWLTVATRVPCSG